MATIASLNVMLTATTAPFTAGLKQGQTALTGFIGAVGGIGSGIGLGLSSALGPLTAIIAGAVTLGKAFSGAVESEQAIGKLNAVLAATGGAVGLTSKELQSFAGELQKTTNFEDDATISAMAVAATFKNIKGDTFKAAITSAADLATVMGVDLKTATMQVSKALNDPTKGITALSRAGVSFSASQKEQIKALQATGDMAGAQKIILQELQGEFAGAAQAAANPLTMLGNAVGDMLESVGKAIIPVVTLIAETFIPVVNTIGDAFAVIAPRVGALITEMASFVGSALGGVGLNFGSFLDIATTAFDFVQAGVIVVEFAFTHWKDVLDLALVGAAYGIVSFANQTIHFFTVAIPGYLDWFGQHWHEVFLDIVNFTSTVASNIWTNLKNLWDGIISLFSGDGFHFEWTPLTDGFKSAITELPKIAEREIGPLEKSLGAQMDSLAGKVGEDFQKFADERTKAIDAKTSDIGKKLGEGLGAFAGNKIEAVTATPDQQLNAGAGKEAKVGALVRGSVEAFKAARGDSYQQKSLDLQQKQLKAAERSADALENQEEDETVEIV